MQGRDFMTYRVGKYTLPEYSVLMSVYDRELPENLNESLESMLMQSYPSCLCATASSPASLISS